ncbi:MAG: hypothetical protein HY077_16165 [Elusimicrobia bacterium]|nr:hypothetical protein [Elusimicrobiota bacterium]
MTTLWPLLLALRLALPAAAVDVAEPVRQLILPGRATRTCGASCGLVLPAGTALPQTAIPQSIPALAGEPVSLASDGTRIAPQLVTPASMAHEAEMSAVSGALRRSVELALPSLKDSVGLGEWKGPGTTLDRPCCGDAAPKLGLLLRNMGYGVHVVEAEMHYYLLNALAGGQLIVDPTIRQFFGGARAPPEIPTVFVGSVAELHRLFEEHASAKRTSHDMQRIYFRDAEIRNARLLELQRALGQEPARVDMGPLARFLERLSRE